MITTPLHGLLCRFCFFFNDTATTEIYTLSLHDALPIWLGDQGDAEAGVHAVADFAGQGEQVGRGRDRKSTRLNSSHRTISYAVFCLKKKKNPITRKAAQAEQRETTGSSTQL